MSDPAIEVSEGCARLSVLVPEGAIVFINGKATGKSGARRDYYSLGLKYGYNYRYVVRAEVWRDGKVVEARQQVFLRAGETKSVALDLSRTNNAQVNSVR